MSKNKHIQTVVECNEAMAKVEDMFLCELFHGNSIQYCRSIELQILYDILPSQLHHVISQDTTPHQDLLGASSNHSCIKFTLIFV